MPQFSIQIDPRPENACARGNQEIIGFWQKTKRSDRIGPCYTQFNPIVLREHIGTLAILRPLDSGDFVYTYFETGGGNDRRTDLTGHLHSSLDHPIARELAQCFWSALQEHQPLLVLHGQLRSRTVHTWEHAIFPVDSPFGPMLVTNMLPIVYKSDLIASIVSTSPGAILACSADAGDSDNLTALKVIMSNHAADRLFQQPEASLVGVDLFGLLQAQARDALRTACNAVARSGNATSLSLDLGLRDREPAQDLTISAFDGGIVLTFAELGALRRAHADLKRREDELIHARAELDRQSAELTRLAQEIEKARASYDAEAGERRRLELELRRLATIDDLTGVLNRRAFFAELNSEVARSARYGHPPTLLYIDIDRFKMINDSYGHAVGDAVIRTTLERVNSMLRAEIDVVGRLGGDEFAILLPETPLKGARIVAERILSVIASTPLMLLDQSIQVTVSIGIAAWNELNSDTSMPEAVNDWVARADAALYRVKHGGRNAVAAADEVAPFAQASSAS